MILNIFDARSSFCSEDEIFRPVQADCHTYLENFAFQRVTSSYTQEGTSIHRGIRRMMSVCEVRGRGGGSSVRTIGGSEVNYLKKKGIFLFFP